jgi:hypothetical protein
MYLSNQSLLVIVVVGIVAGWLAGRVMEGGGFGRIIRPSPDTNTRNGISASSCQRVVNAEKTPASW